MISFLKKRCMALFLVLFLGTTFSYASELEQDSGKKESENQVTSRMSRFVGIPWNFSAGFGVCNSVSSEWIFGEYGGIWFSKSGDENFSRHSLIWTIRNQLIWASDGFGVFWQPNIVYTFSGFPFFVLSVGPEIGFWTDKEFDYGFSLRMGTFFNIIGGEIGYLANRKAFLLNVIINLPIGLGYSV